MRSIGAHQVVLLLVLQLGLTPLCKACWEAFPEVVQLLLRQGADTTIKTKVRTNASDKRINTAYRYWITHWHWVSKQVHMQVLHLPAMHQVSPV